MPRPACRARTGPARLPGRARRPTRRSRGRRPSVGECRSSTDGDVRQRGTALGVRRAARDHGGDRHPVLGEPAHPGRLGAEPVAVGVLDDRGEQQVRAQRPGEQGGDRGEPGRDPVRGTRLDQCPGTRPADDRADVGERARVEVRRWPGDPAEHQPDPAGAGRDPAQRPGEDVGQPAGVGDRDPGTGPDQILQRPLGGGGEGGSRRQAVVHAVVHGGHPITGRAATRRVPH